MTARQALILEFIRLYVGAHQRPPTMREIAHATNISSTSIVSYNLLRLEEQGYLQIDEGIARGIRLTEKE